ncbi:helix-turn-helix domain-containing protein [Pontibacter sp. SGAir0037]|uniref:helix-turn-helix domain-containing protein n=1 Tax=Pontibacter sp. SGAir0037 TaxID=2571030 RepID=UPI0010CD0A94|nr:helix-turn-helix transcriptional regulator [Pontibacter sp. SGAir0037]QCR20990.1 transcriptional regulator [Pontibacter sp. SGAir0037]
METTTRNRHIHVGDNIRRIRTALGIKQATLAQNLNYSQQNISRIEQEEELDEPTLQKVAQALGVPADAIRNFDSEGVSFHIQTMNDNAVGQFTQYNFNPIEKIVELYDALLQSEREKNALLERMLNNHKSGSGEEQV